jgi:hypothetical protein
VLLLNAETGRLTEAMIFVEPPETMRRVDDLIGYGEAVANRFDAWRRAGLASATALTVATFYGDKPFGELLERTAWHCAQHLRQLELMLVAAGISPAVGLTPENLAGLPMPDDVWDD